MSKQAKPARVTDAWLAKWRWSEDRAANSVSLGAFGITATIGKDNEIAFSTRMHLGGGKRPNKNCGYFRAGTYLIEDAIRAAQKQRDHWRAVQSGEKIDIDEDEVPYFRDLPDLYKKARKKGDPDACPNDKGLQKNWDDYAKLFPKVYEGLQDLKVNVIHRAQMLHAHTSYLDAREKETGNRPHTTIRYVWSAARPMVVFGQLKYGMPADATIRVKPVGPPEEDRERILMPREWQLVAPVLDKLYKGTGLPLRYIMATGCRIGMAIEMRWRDLRAMDLGTEDEPHPVLIWCVPGENMKMGHLALFPLVGEGLRIIEGLRADAGGKPDKDAFVFPERVRKAWADTSDRWAKQIFKKSGTKRWTRHDLRRTVASLLEFCGADMPTARKLLAHESDEERNSTGRYLVLSKHLPQLAELAKKLLAVHKLLKDIEDGRVTRDLRDLYRHLDTTPEVHTFMREFDIDRDTMMEVEPSKDAPKAPVHALPKRKAG
jgi:integrase